MSGETRQSESGWTVDTLNAAIQRQIDDLRHLLQERYQTQTKAVDAAFAAAEKAVASALLAAEKAVQKVETATEKRFESVNEFRAQLSDQTATFIPRKEADVRIEVINDKLEAYALRNSERISALELVMSNRNQFIEGRASGVDRSWAFIFKIVGPIIAAISIGVAILR